MSGSDAWQTFRVSGWYDDENETIGAAMVTGEVITRTFQIFLGDASGTCFAIKAHGRMFYVTARHVLEGIESSPLALNWNGQEVSLTVTGYRHHPTEDVSIFTGSGPMVDYSQKEDACDLTAKGLGLGQDCYFLGFPFGLGGAVGEVNNHYPLPFVKRAIVSMLNFPGSDVFYLDGTNNPGFSGGPAVARSSPNRWSIFGVVSGYEGAPEPVYNGDRDTGMHTKANSGLIRVVPIKFALELIDEALTAAAVPLGA